MQRPLPECVRVDRSADHILVDRQGVELVLELIEDGQAIAGDLETALQMQVLSLMVSGVLFVLGVGMAFGHEVFGVSSLLGIAFAVTAAVLVTVLKWLDDRREQAEAKSAHVSVLYQKLAFGREVYGETLPPMDDLQEIIQCDWAVEENITDRDQFLKLFLFKLGVLDDEVDGRGDLATYDVRLVEELPDDSESSGY